MKSNIPHYYKFLSHFLIFNEEPNSLQLQNNIFCLIQLAPNNWRIVSRHYTLKQFDARVFDVIKNQIIIQENHCTIAMFHFH